MSGRTGLRRWWPLLVVGGLVLALAVEVVLGSSLPLRSALTGLLGALVLLFGAKGLGSWIRRPAEYYAEDVDGEAGTRA